MIQREYYLNKLISWKDKKIIKVITGIRRSGKSTLLELYSNYLTKNHVDKNHIIKMNFDNPTFSDDLKYKNIYNIISEKIKDKNMYYILLDEIQEVEEFQKAVNGLFLLDNVDIYTLLVLIHI